MDNKLKQLFTVSYVKNVFIRNFYEVFFIALFVTALQRPPTSHFRVPSQTELQSFTNKFISIFLIYMLMDTFAPQFVDNMRVGIAIAIGTQLSGGVMLKQKA